LGESEKWDGMGREGRRWTKEKKWASERQTESVLCGRGGAPEVVRSSLNVLLRGRGEF
jgi:hypothetical protein